MFGRLKNKIIIKPFENSHPIVIFVYFLMVIVLAIIQRSYFIIIIMAIGSVIMDYYYNPDSFFKDLIYSGILVIITTITNPLFVSSGVDVIYQNDYITITLQALIYGFVFGLLLASMLLWFRVLRKCLKDSHIVYLFGSLLPTLGLVISMSFNIINKLKNQYQKIKEANQNMPSKSKLTYYRNILIVLVTYAFESSLDMMNSMSARGYGQGKRTSFHLYSFRKDDGLKLIVIIFLAIVCFWGYISRYHDFYYYPMIQTFNFNWIDSLFMMGYLVLTLVPLYLGGKKDV